MRFARKAPQEEEQSTSAHALGKHPKTKGVIGTDALPSIGMNYH